MKKPLRVFESVWPRQRIWDLPKAGPRSCARPCARCRGVVGFWCIFRSMRRDRRGAPLATRRAVNLRGLAFRDEAPFRGPLPPHSVQALPRELGASALAHGGAEASDSRIAELWRVGPVSWHCRPPAHAGPSAYAVESPRGPKQETPSGFPLDPPRIVSTLTSDEDHKRFSRGPQPRTKRAKTAN